MAQMISRRKLAQYASGKIAAGNTQQAVQELAAYLLQSGREREAGLIARDIEAELAERGIVVATVTTARPLTAELKKAVQSMTGAAPGNIREVVDPEVLGGIRVELPGKQFDGTLRRKLTMLKELTVN